MSTKKVQAPSIRSSAAEYLTFVAGSGTDDVNAIYADENIWLSQKMLALLYDVNVRTVNEHLQNIFNDTELQESTVIRKFRITAADGKGYDTQHYKHSAIIAVDYKVNSERAVQFRKWAIHGQTAAELIVARANADKVNMGLSTWKDALQGKIQKFDVSFAKNYLTEDEMAQLQRLVSAYLDIAEDMALRKIPMTMQDWETRLNRFIGTTDREILQDAGKVTAEIAKAHAEAEFEKYRVVQDRLYESDFDRVIKGIDPTGGEA